MRSLRGGGGGSAEFQVCPVPRTIEVVSSTRLHFPQPKRRLSKKYNYSSRVRRCFIRCVFVCVYVGITMQPKHYPHRIQRFSKAETWNSERYRPYRYLASSFAYNPTPTHVRKQSTHTHSQGTIRTAFVLQQYI